MQKFFTFIFIIAAGFGLAVFWSKISNMGNVFQVDSGVVLNRAVIGSDKPETIENKSTAKMDVVAQEPLPDAKTLEKLNAAPAVVLNPALQGFTKSVQGNAANELALTRAGVIAQTNIQRQTILGAGFGLHENSLLDIAAQNKVNDMFSGQYFEHTSPKGADAGDLAIAAGYEYILVGENLAMGDFDSDTDLVQAWMDSPGHRENILRAGYEEIGVAVGYGMFKGRKTWLAVQEFGIPRSACPGIDEALSLAIDGAKSKLDAFGSARDQLLSKIEQERKTALVLEKELDGLAAAGGSYDAAKSKQEELNRAVARLNGDIDNYNAAIALMRSQYEHYKKDINEYNRQMAVFNDCLGFFHK
jgi:uncharacterized protein YkwD